MTLDLLHADAVTGAEPVGLVTSGGSGSILHAVLAYREWRAADARHRPPQLREARDRAPRVRQGVPPARRRAAARRRSIPKTTLVDVDAVAKLIDENTIAIVGSACNYGYGTIDPISELSDLALERGIGLHVDGCLGGFILPWGQELGYDIPRVRLPRPGRHVDLGRHAQVRLRLQGHVGARVPRQGAPQQPVLLHDRLDGREVRVAGHRGLALRRPARGDVGGDGEHRARPATSSTRARSSRPRSRCRTPCARTPSCASWARTRRSASASRATSSTSTTSTTSCGRRAGASTVSSTRTRSTWRSRDRRRNPACVEAFAADLAEAVAYAHEHKDDKPQSGAVYGGVEGGHDRRGRRVHPRASWPTCSTSTRACLGPEPEASAVMTVPRGRCRTLVRATRSNRLTGREIQSE